MSDELTWAMFLNRVIEDGVAAAEHDYAKDEKKRRGAVAGFRACTKDTPAELALLLADANDKMSEAFRNAHEGLETWNAEKSESWPYWYWRCYAAEVEWVCNVVSAMLVNEGRPVIVTPTARGVMKAAEILNGVTR